MKVATYRKEPSECHPHWLPEAGHQGQTPARACRAITEEVAVTDGVRGIEGHGAGGEGGRVYRAGGEGGRVYGAGGEGGGVDLVVGEAGWRRTWRFAAHRSRSQWSGLAGSGWMKAVAAGPKARVRALWTSGPTW